MRLFVKLEVAMLSVRLVDPSDHPCGCMLMRGFGDEHLNPPSKPTTLQIILPMRI